MTERQAEYSTAKPYYRNPRQTTKARLAKLDANLTKYGDLGGIVHNVRSNQIIGGNQRTAIFQAASTIQIVEQYDKPDAQGTIAWGFIVYKGGKFPYRRVDWDAETESAANLIANTDAGFWDFDIAANMWQPAELMEWAGWDMEQLQIDKRLVAAKGNFLYSEELTPSKSLDELEKEYGEPQEQDFWPIIKVKVSPEINEKYQAIMTAMPGRDEMEKFDALISRVEIQ